MSEVKWIGTGFRGNAKLVYEEIQSIGSRRGEGYGRYHIESVK